MYDKKLEIVLAAKDITGKAFGKFQGRLKGITSQVVSMKGALAGLLGVGGIIGLTSAFGNWARRNYH